MADTGYIYVNGVRGAGYYSDIYFDMARYTFEKPNDVIIYIESVTKNVNIDGANHQLKGNKYYLLGNNAVKEITQKGICVYVRGEASGQRYLNNSMDYIYFDSSMFDISNAEYSMGGSGMNGYVKTGGLEIGYYSSDSYIPIRGDFDDTLTNTTKQLTLKNGKTTPFSIGVPDVDPFYSDRYISKPSRKLYKVSNFFNKYSSEYYNNK